MFHDSVELSTPLRSAKAIQIPHCPDLKKMEFTLTVFLVEKYRTTTTTNTTSSIIGARKIASRGEIFLVPSQTKKKNGEMESTSS